ncbi:MAG: DUF3048 domain-containing protein [Acidimicrobiia bacterium]|nr:DUF3048 domain-containing protein [Acidimicrobiia bacterium]
MFRRTPLTLAVLSIVLTAACSGSSAATIEPVVSTTTEPSTTTTTVAPTTTSSTTTTTLPAGPMSPLDGLSVDDPLLLERRVMAVKIDNHWNARPQSGIQEADAVYELLVEAGLTRFIALFHDSDSSYLGPMRSGRPTDPTLLRPLGATFTISGAQPWVINRITAAGVSLIGEVRPATFRVSGRYAPHNLYVDTAALREYADGRGYPDEPPPDLFAWDAWPAGDRQKATEITLSWSPGLQVMWQWDGERYVRFTGGEPHEWISQEGEAAQIATDTLVVLLARRYTASPSGAGSSVPAMETVGTGRALVFSGGEVEEGVWTRASIEEPFALTKADGSTLTVPPGKPWVSVFPDTRTLSW